MSDLDESPDAIDLNNQGVEFTQQGDFDNALECFNRAIKLDPKYDRVYHNRGYVWLQKEEFHKAIDDYSQAIEFNPNFALSYSDRGTAWYEEGEFERAIEDYTSALKLDPNLATVYHNRAMLYEEEEKFAPAIADYERAIELNPDYADACYQLAGLMATSPHSKYRNGKRAVELAHHACELTDFKAWECLDTLAAAHAEVSDFVEAMKWQLEAIQMAPDVACREAAKSRLELYRGRKPCRDLSSL